MATLLSLNWEVGSQVFMITTLQLMCMLLTQFVSQGKNSITVILEAQGRDECCSGDTHATAGRKC